MNNSDLDNVLRTLSVPDCINALEKLNEKERKALSERALQWLTVSTGHNLNEPQLQFWLTRAGGLAKIATALGGSMELPKDIQRMFNHIEEAKKLAGQLPPEAIKPAAIEPARVAVFGTCTLTEIKKYDGQPVNVDVCYQLLVARKPRWTEQWAAYVLGDDARIYWRLIRRLETEGMITMAVDSDYLLGMAVGMAAAGNIADQLRQDQILRERLWPMLEEDDVTRLFIGQPPSKVKRRRDIWQWRDYVRGYNKDWSAALAEVAQEGTISRLQLLNVTAAVLTRVALEASEGASKLDLTWFSNLHAQLSPTSEEDAALAESYIRLLYSRNAATVGWIIGRLKEMVLAHTDVPVESLCAALESVFLVKGKENALKALDCLATIAETIPSARCAVGLAALGALENDSQDIQKRSISLLEKYGKDQGEVAQKLRDNLDRVAIVHRERAQNWLQKQSGGGGADGAKGGVVSGAASGAARGATGGAAGSAARGATGGAVSGAAGGGDTEIASEAANANVVRLPERSVVDVAQRLEGLSEAWQSCAGVKTAIKAIEDGAPDVPALDFDGTEYPRLNPDKAFQPVENFDELVFLMAKLLQNYELSLNADELERALDAIARLGAAPPADYQQRLQAIAALPMFGPIGGGLELWLKGAKLSSRYSYTKPHPIDQMLVSRFDCAGKQARERKPSVMLSRPTHQGGWIDPMVLVERVLSPVTQNDSSNNPSASGQQDLKSLAAQVLTGATNYVLSAVGITSILQVQDGDLLDQSLALLRLAPDNRKQALFQLVSAAPKQSEFINALRYALGDGSVQIGSSAHLWIAAARARAPFADDDAVESKFPGCGPDGGQAAQYPLLTNIIKKTVSEYYARLTNAQSFAKPKWDDFRLFDRLPKATGSDDKLDGIVTAAAHRGGDRSRYQTCPFNNRDWASTMSPLIIESWFAHGVEAIARSEARSTSSSMEDTFIEKLYDPDVPLKQMALLTLVIGLSCKSAPAVEALIQTIDDGRLNSNKLARIMNTLRELERPLGADEYAVPLVSLTRWSKAMKTAVLTSPYHALVIRGAIEQMLSGDPANAPKDLHTILEVLLEISIQQQQSITRADARQYLSGIKTSGKTAKLVKQLLALKKGPDGDSICAEALAYALEKRIERAQRWQSWCERNEKAGRKSAPLAVT